MLQILPHVHGIIKCKDLNLDLESRHEKSNLNYILNYVAFSFIRISYVNFRFSFFLMSGKIYIKSDFLVLCCNKDENVIWSLLKSHFILHFFLSSPQRISWDWWWLFWYFDVRPMMAENMKIVELLKVHLRSPLTSLKEPGQILTSFQYYSGHS